MSGEAWGFVPWVLVIGAILWMAFKPTRFCSRCGKRLEKRQYLAAYDTFTGEQIRRSFKACPDYRDDLPGLYGDNRCISAPPDPSPGAGY